MTRRLSPLGLSLNYPDPSGDVNVNVTGAASAGEAGTVTINADGNLTLTGAGSNAQAGTVAASFGRRVARLGPLGLPQLYRGAQQVTLTGAESAAEAGTVTVEGNAITIIGAQSNAESGNVTPVEASPIRGQLGPLGIAQKRRNISPKGDTDAFVNITGAEIQGQWATPDLTDVDVYADSALVGEGEDQYDIAMVGEAGSSGGDADEDVFAQPSGAETAGEAGTVTATELQQVFITGAESLAESGQASGVGTITANADADAVGAESLAEAGAAAVPNVGVGVSGAESLAQTTPVAVPAGSVVAGAASAGEAGTVTASTDLSVNVTGAESLAEAGGATARNEFDAAATPLGAESPAEAGTPTLILDYAQAVVGAQIGVEESEVGIDTGGTGPDDVNVTITGADMDGLTGTVGFVNLYPIAVTGAAIQGQAHEVESGFGEDDLGLSDSTDRFNGVVGSLAVKVPCRTATTANITLSGHQTINGLALVTDDRVLVTAQTNAVENGIYVVDSSDWGRAPDFDGNRDIVRGTLVTVTNE